MSAEFGPTNIVMDAHDVIVPEDMTPDMKLVVLLDGSVKFVVDEEYQDGIYI